MKLLGNRLLIEPIPHTLKTECGIVLLERFHDNQMYYRVVKSGPGRKLKDGTVLPPEPKPGDRILIHSFQGTQFHFDNNQRIVDATDVLMVL